MLRAATIMESMVAFIILLGVFGTGITIYIQVTASEKGFMHLQARQVLYNDKNKKSISTVIDIEEEILPYKGIENLQLKVITARDEQGKILHCRKILEMNEK